MQANANDRVERAAVDVVLADVFARIVSKLDPVLLNTMPGVVRPAARSHACAGGQTAHASAPTHLSRRGPQAAIRKWLSRFSSDRDFPPALKPLFHTRTASSVGVDVPHASPPH